MKTFSDVQAEYRECIPYSELLLCKEWFDRREKIIRRDKNNCQICGKHGPDIWIPKPIYLKEGKIDVIEVPAILEEVLKSHNVKTVCGNTIEVDYPTMKPVEVKDAHFIHVHHKYYILNHLPWEYPDDALITVCYKCHEKIHKNERVLVFENEELCSIVNIVVCPRCNGQGIFPQYSHVMNGICFECGGAIFSQKK